MRGRHWDGLCTRAWGQFVGFRVFRTCLTRFSWALLRCCWALCACMLTFAGHEADVYSAVFFLDDVSVLIASKDRTGKIWDSATGACKLTLTGPRGM